MQRIIKRLFLLSLCIATASAQIILEDFATVRTNSDKPPDQLFALYLGEDQYQIDHGFANGVWHVTGDVATDTTNNCYTGCGIYWNMLTYPYVWPGGFMQSYVKSGTFTSNVNRMNLKFYCSANVARDPNGGNTLEVGTYIKPHNSTDYTDQGQHYYHQFDFNIYNGHWILAELNMQPQHIVGGPNTDPPYDPEFNAPTRGAPVHYFDGMTRWYFDTQTGSGLAQADCYFKDIELRQVDNEPDTLVASTTGQWNGNQFEVSWATQANTSQVYSIYYSRSSMHVAGLSSGTAGGTVQATGNTYKGVYWKSPSLPLASGLYVAIQPQGSSQFTEVFIPPMDSTGQTSQCDLNNDGTVNAADYALSQQQALGQSACTGDLNGDGLCTVVDVQRVANAANGGACKVGP